MPNIELGSPIPITSFRKLSLGAWKRPNNSTTHLSLDLTVSNALDYLKTLNQHATTPVSLSHLFAKIMATCLTHYPALNRVLIRKKIYQRQHIHISFATLLKSATPEPDLSLIAIDHANRLSLQTIATTVAKKVAHLRNGHDTEITTVKKWVHWIPRFLYHPLIALFDFILYTCNLPLTCFGLPKDRHGSIAITSIGSLGYDCAFIPLYPFSRCSLIMAIGKVQKKPTVENNQLVIRDRVTLTFTLDHRILDGAHGAKALRLFKKLVATPTLLDH